ncbi:MAG: hypothetical protein NVS4B2_31820 [Chloroflexota bacterium]
MPEERKLITVFFADVTGSTALGDELDPEDVRALMGRYYEHARTAATDHGGTLEKFIGDAAMAIFGLPHAHGDDAERAVAAALALRTAVTQDPVLRERVMLRIGVNTGEVVAASDPSGGDFLVTGDAVNVAARLQQCANPGEILVGERTEAATTAAFAYEAERQVEVKGKGYPLRVFPLAGTRAVRRVERPPLVGRKQDLMQLALLQSRALEEQRPQLVSILAPAGTGKTRLLEEFQRRWDPEEGWRVATGRSLPYGQSLTYWPLRGLLEDLIGAIDRERIVGAFTQAGDTAADASHLADLILATFGGETQGFVELESLFNAWRRLIETLAKQSPRVVIFEDLHWASDSLLDFVEHIMHPRTRAPLLVIVTSRPELLDRRPVWGGGRQNFSALVLEPLNDVQTATLVEQLGAQLPESVRRRIAERSGGNPFFATELVRGLMERGTSADMDAVPDTVHGAVLARLDLLSPTERAVLQAAAIAGRAFSPAVLQALLPNQAPDKIDTTLDGLVARDLIVSEDQDRFTFRHILIRDVAYGTLSRAERIRMHAAVAGWLERAAADRLDEFAGLIAFHYQEAITLSRRSAVPLPLPFDILHAGQMLERAGDLAERAGAMIEARDHLQSAISLAPKTEHGRLYEKLGDCVLLSEAAPDAYAEALKLWRASSPTHPGTGARLLRKLLLYHTRWSLPGRERPNGDEMNRMYAEAFRLAGEAGNEEELWKLRVAKVFSYISFDGSPLSSADIEEGQHVGLAAADYFEAHGDWESFSVALDAYMGMSDRGGMYSDVLHAGKRRLCAPGLTEMERGDALQMIAWAHHNLGEYDQCIALVDDALRHTQPGESIIHFGLAVSIAIQASWFNGRWGTCVDFMPTIEEARHQIQDVADAAIFIPAYMSALHLAMARDDRATADVAAAFLARVLPPEFQVAAMITAYREDDPRKVDLDSRTFPFAQATVFPLLFFTERGLALPHALLDYVLREPQCRSIDVIVRCLAIAQALAAGDTARLALAIDDAEQHGLIPHAARMRIVLAQLTNDRSPLERARPVLERLEDRQFLRRLEEVAVGLE